MLKCWCRVNFNKVRQRVRLRNTGRPLNKSVLSCGDLESRFYAVLPKAASKLPSVKATPIEVPGPKRPKGRESVGISRKDRNSVFTLGRYIMNEFTEKNEQASSDACGAISVEPNATVNMQKGRYLVAEFLKNPVSWLETEVLYHSYTTRGEAQDVANGIDRMISESAIVGQSKLFPGPKRSSTPLDTAFGS